MRRMNNLDHSTQSTLLDAFQRQITFVESNKDNQTQILEEYFNLSITPSNETKLSHTKESGSPTPEISGKPPIYPKASTSNPNPTETKTGQSAPFQLNQVPSQPSCQTSIAPNASSLDQTNHQTNQQPIEPANMSTPPDFDMELNKSTEQADEEERFPCIPAEDNKERFPGMIIENDEGEPQLSAIEAINPASGSATLPAAAAAKITVPHNPKEKGKGRKALVTAPARASTRIKGLKETIPPIKEPAKPSLKMKSKATVPAPVIPSPPKPTLNNEPRRLLRSHSHRSQATSDKPSSTSLFTKVGQEAYESPKQDGLASKAPVDEVEEKSELLKEEKTSMKILTYSI
ncbi:uncharacterized protein MELLADRAFT_87953 [Melampsora larici-populina 98AG31]|uniref:Uncharacterized protein n=1 Tax=Melampsora larici-populina (strain 98AG31 / pathotype 3-4-7) TaxID=747676 RepID=F4RQI4_MELLP|nr:uncharacterized protein MELLADRAFT_87953 [Melampsora larici-populina 98AG31]EGG05303.1 hypothetical protein MELLADRAFT_87953 [Melampsora larici-populina 98AG31]